MKASSPLALFLALSLGLFPILLLFACSGQPPVIASVDWNIVTRPRAGGGWYEVLSVFVLANDPDGNMELESILVANDQAELVWKLDEDTWTRRDEGERLWLGSNGLAMPAGEDIPAGEYRIILTDVGGSADERSIVVPAHSRSPLFSASYSHPVLSSNQPFPDTQAVLLDAAGQVISMAAFRSGSKDIASIFGGESVSSRGKELFLVSLDKAGHRAVFSPKFRLP